MDALHELGVNDEETLNSLSAKYRNLLENEKEIRAYYSGQPAYLDRLYGKHSINHFLVKIIILLFIQIGTVFYLKALKTNYIYNTVNSCRNMWLLLILF